MKQEAQYLTTKDSGKREERKKERDETSMNEWMSLQTEGPIAGPAQWVTKGPH